VWTVTAQHVRTVLAPHRGIRGAAIADGGRTLVLAEDTRALVWSQLGADRSRARGGTTPTVLASRDGVAVTGDEAGGLWVWSPGAPRRIGGHTAAVRALAVSPDARHVVSTGDDHTVRRWSLAGEAPEIVGALAVSREASTGDDHGPPEIVGVHHGVGLA